MIYKVHHNGFQPFVRVFIWEKENIKFELLKKGKA